MNESPCALPPAPSAPPSRSVDATNSTTTIDEERIARAELTWICEPGDHILGRLVAATGAIRAMALIRACRIHDDAGLELNGDPQAAVDRQHSALEKLPTRAEVEPALGGQLRLVYPRVC